MQLCLKHIFLLSAVCLLSSTAVNAAMEVPSGMQITADKMTHQGDQDLLVADGGVTVIWQGSVLTADEVRLDRVRNILSAHGNVVMTKADDTMRGDSLIIDTETGRGEMENGRVFMAQGNFHIYGSQMARVGDEQYSMKNGCLTTCNGEVPSWKIKAEDMDVTVEQYATGKNVVFYVKDLPVFYFPYILFPVKTERQSGLLFPKFGNSSKRGAFLELPVYWAISPSQEATVTLDIQTKRGVGTGLDYRYLRNRDSKGSLGGYIIYDNNEHKVRGQLLQEHFEQLTDSIYFATSVNLTSDRSYLHDYGDASGEYNRQYYDTRAVIVKQWQNWLAYTQAVYVQDFTGSNSATLQRLPELYLHGVRQSLPYLPNVWFDLDAVATNYQREKGFEGQRAVITPQLSTSQSFFDGRLTATLQGGVQLRGYNTSDAPVETKDKALVAVPQLQAEIGSSFSKLYNGSKALGLERIRHELVPSISYSYMPDKDQDIYPYYNQDDRTPDLSLLQFSIASHLGGKLIAAEGDKKPATYRHLQTIRFRQGYSLDGVRPLLLNDTDHKGHWSEAVLESETWLHPAFRLLADARYNHSAKQISTTALGGDFVFGDGNSVGASYRKIRNQVEYLEGRITTSLLQPVYLGYLSRYSLDKRDILENYATIEYRHQCWSAFFAWRERPGNRSWTINFNLAGLFDSNRAFK